MRDNLAPKGVDYLPRDIFLTFYDLDDVIHERCNLGSFLRLE